MSETVNKYHTTLQFVKERIGNNIIAQLDKWMCQGTYGDATMNPETVQIFSYLREVNPNIRIEMWTNGGARDIEFWKRMAKLKVNVIFGIDGLEDTNHIYLFSKNGLNKEFKKNTKLRIAKNLIEYIVNNEI